MALKQLWDPQKGNLVVNIPRINKLDAIVDPAVTNDISQGYEAGSMWVNVTGQRVWRCVSAAVGAAVWLGESMGATAVLGVQAAPAAKTVSATLTAAEVLTRLITGNQGGAAGAAYTLPLATDFEAAVAAIYGTLIAGNYIDFSVINISTVAAEVITVTTNTGWTLVGDMTLAANATGDQSGGLFRAVRTSATAWVLYRRA